MAYVNNSLQENVMPRPYKARRICKTPISQKFGPLDMQGGEGIEMTLEEFETLRLIDLLGCTQEECARQMEVARTTVQAVYNSARKKTADALVNGRQLFIQGGNYSICPRAEHCHAGDENQNRCGGRCCGRRRQGTGVCKKD